MYIEAGSTFFHYATYPRWCWIFDAFEETLKESFIENQYLEVLEDNGLEFVRIL
jgi:hypothetical protein